MSEIKQKRRITESIKKTVAGKQSYKCAATVADYKCPLYRRGGDGAFDESGYEIDHIEEFSKNGNDDINNLQALCPMCHRVKTKRFNQQTKTKREPRTRYDISINVFNQQDCILTKSIKIKNYDNTMNVNDFFSNDKKLTCNKNEDDICSIRKASTNKKSSKKRELTEAQKSYRNYLIECQAKGMSFREAMRNKSEHLKK